MKPAPAAAFAEESYCARRTARHAPPCKSRNHRWPRGLPRRSAELEAAAGTACGGGQQNAKVRFQCALKSRSGRMIGGQNGTLLLYPSCYAYYFPLIVAVHHGLGFYVYWISFTGHEVVDRATFDKLASTLRFTS